jgi:nucleoside-diphosphate-sugar epimerase
LVTEASGFIASRIAEQLLASGYRVRGTERAPGVKRVVVTSSVAAITDQDHGHLNTENDWNTRSSLARNPTSDELGLVFRDVDQTILDTKENLDRWGLGKKR